MNAEFFAALDALEEEKEIPKEYMLEKIEAALVTAFKRDNSNSNVKVYADETKKEIRVFQLKEIVEEVEDEQMQIDLASAKKISSRYKLGDFAEIEFKPKEFGRISAQTAKQVIIQGIREHERAMLAKEFESKKEQLITANIYKIDPIRGNAILRFGKNEAVLQKEEQIPNEILKEGDNIKVYVTEIKNQINGAPIAILSRKHAGFIRRLFEAEVPEIADGSVMIHSLAREPGSRSKIAVSSSVPKLNAVSACVGPKRSRMQAVLKEISGEKVDIISYSEDPAEFIKAALAPANGITEVTVEDEERVCHVLVDETQLSLAIGKAGQNARLAARLTGYKIDIKGVFVEKPPEPEKPEKKKKKDKQEKQNNQENPQQSQQPQQPNNNNAEIILDENGEPIAPPKKKKKKKKKKNKNLNAVVLDENGEPIVNAENLNGENVNNVGDDALVVPINETPTQNINPEV